MSYEGRSIKSDSKIYSFINYQGKRAKIILIKRKKSDKILPGTLTNDIYAQSAEENSSYN